MPLTPDESVARIAAGLLSTLEPLTDELVALIAAQIDIYRPGSVVAPIDLHNSVRHNLSFMLGRLAVTAAPDLSAPRRTGRERAEQGAPLPEVLRAYRIGFAFLWDRLLAEARRSEVGSLDALLETATGIWALADDYSLALTEAYRHAVAEQMVAADRRRSVLVEALTSGPTAGRETAWELAKLLDLPYEGSFLVVIAETTTIGADALPGLEDRLRTLDVASAWRTRPDFEVVVLSCGRRRPAIEVAGVVGDFATARVGISPEFSRLDETPRALRFAQIALESLPPGPGARQLEDGPLGELVMGSYDVTGRVVRRILRGVLVLPDDERSSLLSTAEAWLDARGSAQEAGRALYCHENTVRYRMKRLEEYIGRSFDDPRAVAELATALEAIRTFPALGERLSEAPGPRADPTDGPA